MKRILLLLSCISGIEYASEAPSIPVQAVHKFTALCKSPGSSIDEARTLLDQHPLLANIAIKLRPQDYIADMAQASVAIQGPKPFEDIPLPQELTEAIVATTDPGEERRTRFAVHQAQEKIRQQLKNPNSQAQCTTPCSLACMAGNVLLVKLLYEKSNFKSDLLNPPPGCDSPLANAICSGNFPLVRFLLKDCPEMRIPQTIFNVPPAKYAGTLAGPNGRAMVEVCLKPLYPSDPIPYKQEDYQKIHRLVIQSSLAQSSNQSSTS